MVLSVEQIMRDKCKKKILMKALWQIASLDFLVDNFSYFTFLFLIPLYFSQWGIGEVNDFACFRWDFFIWGSLGNLKYVNEKSSINRFQDNWCYT